MKTLKPTSQKNRNHERLLRTTINICQYNLEETNKFSVQSSKTKPGRNRKCEQANYQ